MKLKNHIPITVLALCLAVLGGGLLAPQVSSAQDISSWWGSSAWFDWSDFRGAAGARLFLARLTSGNIRFGNQVGQEVELDLKNSTFGLTADPEPFKEFWGILYIDRLGLRGNAEPRVFSGMGPNQVVMAEIGSGPISELDVGTSRLGLDLDLIRYPFFRFGANFDYHIQNIKFRRKLQNITTNIFDETRYESALPVTIGIHAKAIPVRIREVPVTVQARFRFPMPLLNRKNEAKIKDWEISAGLRPAIWETSLLGHSTFSVSIEGGFRSLLLNAEAEVKESSGNPIFPFVTNPKSINIDALWQGAFVQIAAFF